MCSLKVVTMLALHHKEPSIYCHFFCGFCVVYLFSWLAVSDRGVSVCGSWMPLKLVSQESAHCVSQHFKFYSQQRCSKDNVL